MSKKIRNILGFFWAVPMSIFGWLFGLFLLLTWQVDSIEVQEDWTFVWDLKNWGWFQKKSMEGRGWAGFSIGNNVFIKDVVGKRWSRTLAHEVAHCHQWYTLGLLFPLVYILESVRLYVFEKELHSYYDNRFEMEARKCAGQPVKIPRSQWKDGPTDRWAWW
jgi:hypothetical protein